MLFNFFKRERKKRFILSYFCTPLVWHCNLNCRYCDHFSPIAEKKFFAIKKLKKDFKRIDKFFDIKSIGLMGGEPLLHPQISEILEMTRKIFPSAYLMIFTNGILLDKMEENFWKICYFNKIAIKISKYDVHLNEKSIFAKAQKYGVPVSYYGAAAGEYKTMYKMTLDLSGNQNALEMHKICWQNKGGCTYFEDGKFYQCCVAGNIFHFNKFFNKNLEITKNDFIDIYKIKNPKQIEQYFSSKMDFCRYCDMKSQKQNLPFEISQKDIHDWCL